MTRFYAKIEAPIKPTRRTPKTAARFGAGILASRPSVGLKPYTERDLIDAAEMFAEDEARRVDADLERRAIEAEWQDHVSWTASTTESRCGLCGLLTPDDELDGRSEMCTSCHSASEDASERMTNLTNGLGYEIY